MSPLSQLIDDLIVYSGFQEKHAAIAHLLAGGLAAAFVAQARRIARLLEVHAEIDQVDQDLHMRLWLHRPTHNAETQPGLAVFGNECRDDGVERAFARLEAVGMALFKAEQLTAVLQVEAEAGRYHARTHAAVIALDQRDHVAVFIGRGKVNGIAVFQLRVSRRIYDRCLIHRQEFSPPVCIFLRNQFLDRHIGEIGIGIELRPVLESQFLRFGQHVQVVSAAKTH